MLSKTKELEDELLVWEELKKKYRYLLDNAHTNKEMAEVSLKFNELSNKKPLIEAELKGRNDREKELQELINELHKSVSE